MEALTWAGLTGICQRIWLGRVAGWVMSNEQGWQTGLNMKGKFKIIRYLILDYNKIIFA